MKVQAAETIFQQGQLDRKVSVIIPLHNYAHFIEETLDSVARQTFQDLAVIVIDDASTDQSRAVAERWMRTVDAPHLTRILLANKQNARLSITRNTGIDHARSEYCFFLDADNLLFPKCIEKHVVALDRNKGCIGAYSIIEEFGDVEALIGTNIFNRDRLKHGNYIDAMVMMRREAVERLEGFLPIKYGWEDYELWLRMCEQDERLLHIPEILSRYRHHQTSMLRQQTNIRQNILDLHRNIEALHPWVKLDAPSPQPAVRPVHTANMAGTAGGKATVPPSSANSIHPYKQYQNKILGKLDALSHQRLHPVNVEIDTDFTGPIYGTPFDAFASPRQREDSASHTRKMLRLGIVAINPRPGVHAARQEDGDHIRYRSLVADNDIVERLPADMLIHIHAFYPDVVEEMLEYFVGDARGGRFLITTTTQKNFDLVEEIVEDQEFTGAHVMLVDNNGRDNGPFLDHVVDYAFEGDTICHIHTKKSPEVGGSYGEKWRRALYGALLNQTAVDAFGDNDLGLLFPDTSRSVGWGKNKSFCEDIARNLGCSLPRHPGPMPVGNMFFARIEVARAMRKGTHGMPWPREPVPYDGSILHAIERMWPIACNAVGLEWAAIHVPADVGNNLTQSSKAQWARKV